MRTLLDNNSVFYFSFFFMQFSDEQINKFMELYESSFGEKLERKVAFEYAEKLYRAMELTYVQVTVEDMEKLQARRKETENLTIKK